MGIKVTIIGDGGIISPYNVYEYAQSAVIAWNNGKEYLMLEVGIHAEYSEDVNEIKALRVIPLPALPKVISGNEAVFHKLIDLIREKDREQEMYVWGGAGKAYAGGGEEEWSDFIYYGSIGVGPHTVGLFKILSTGNMTEKVREVLKTMNIEYNWSPDPYGAQILSKYIENGYNYFAFDYISLPKDVYYSSPKIEPVAFIFKSPTIYYPVEITFLNPGNYGYSSIVLYVITPKGVDIHSTSLGEFKWEKRYRVSNEELRNLDKNIASIVSSGYLDVFLATHLTRGTEVWNFEGKPRSIDPYLEETLPIFIAFSLIAIVATVLPIISRKRKGKKRKVAWEKVAFGILILLIIATLYLSHLHYMQAVEVWGRYSTPKSQEIRVYYFTEIYIVLGLSLAYLILALRLKTKLSIFITLLSVLWGVLIALGYMEYIKLPTEMFGILLALFAVLVLPYEMRKGFSTTGRSFQKKLALTIGIPLFIFAFWPAFQVVDMGFYALFMGLTYLQGEVKFSAAED